MIKFDYGDYMKTIINDYISELEINKSKFITLLYRVKSIDDVKNKLSYVKDLYKDATHYCYAYIIDDNKKSSDDGEPGGTAGVPIMEVLLKNDLNFVLCVVVRYFGGIKLGAGGLIRAYSKAVSEACKVATFTNIETRHKYKLTFGYDLIGKIEFHLKDEVEIIDKEYDEQVTFTYLCKEPIDTKIQEITNGQFVPTYLETLEVEVTIERKEL